MNAKELLSKVEAVRPHRSGWQARCPAHDDREPSLSVSEKDGKILVHCHAGCSVEAICQALGIETRDLFEKSANGNRAADTKADTRKSTPQGKAIAEYLYRDDAGNPAAKKIRYEPKSFSWLRFENGDWKAGLGTVKPSLYRWPEVKESPEIILTEGEKDADAGARIGLPVTTSGGVNSWREDHAECLRGKSVAIITDADEPGRLHARKVATTLEGRAARVKIVEIPGSKDLAEAIQKGIPKEALMAAIQDAPEWIPTSAAALLDAIMEFIKRFVAVIEPQARVVTLWIAHTHVFAAAEMTPYLSITSAEKQCGKSRLLEVLQMLVAKPWLTGRTSPAALYRSIDKDGPTLLLDETDAAFQSGEEYSQILRGILNFGFSIGGTVRVCDMIGKTFQPRDFVCYCPKALAGIGSLPDTVSDRSLPIRLKRALRGTVAKLRRRQAAPEANRLQADLAAWAASAVTRLRDAEPEMPPGLSDRQADVCEPLVAIADLAGGDWPRAARDSLETLCTTRESDDVSLRVRLLGDIRRIFAGEFNTTSEPRLRDDPLPIDRISSGELIKALTEIETSPWAELNHGKPITPIRLAQMLKPFEIAPRTLRFNGSAMKGYVAGDFQDTFSRYLVSVTEDQQSEDGTVE